MSVFEYRSQEFRHKDYKYLDIEFKSSSESRDTLILSFFFGLYEIKIRSILCQGYAVNTIERLENFVNELNAETLPSKIMTSCDIYKQFHKALDTNQQNYETLIKWLELYICSSEENITSSILPFLNYRIEDLLNKSRGKEQKDIIPFLCEYFSLSCWIISDTNPTAQLVCSDFSQNRHQPILYLHEWKDKSIGFISFKCFINIEAKNSWQTQDLLSFPFRIDLQDQSTKRELCKMLELNKVIIEYNNKKSENFKTPPSIAIEEVKVPKIDNRNSEIPLKNSEIDKSILKISIEKAFSEGIPTPLDKRSWENNLKITNLSTDKPKVHTKNSQIEEVFYKPKVHNKDSKWSSISSVDPEESNSFTYKEKELNNKSNEIDKHHLNSIVSEADKIKDLRKENPKISQEFKSPKQPEKPNHKDTTQNMIEKKSPNSAKKEKKSLISNSRDNGPSKRSLPKRLGIIRINSFFGKEDQKALQALIECYRITSLSPKQKILNKLGLSEKSMEAILNQSQIFCIFCSDPLATEDFSSFSCSTKCKVCIKCREQACPKNCPKCIRPYSDSEIAIVSR